MEFKVHNLGISIIGCSIDLRKAICWRTQESKLTQEGYPWRTPETKLIIIYYYWY